MAPPVEAVGPVEPDPADRSLVADVARRLRHPRHRQGAIADPRRGPLRQVIWRRAHPLGVRPAAWRAADPGPRPGAALRARLAPDRHADAARSRRSLSGAA